MTVSWEDLVKAMDRLAPRGAPRRKLLQIISIILIFEGISVLILFSYFGAILGFSSIVLGSLLIVLLNPDVFHRRGVPEATAPRETTPGLKLVDLIVDVFGEGSLTVAGAVIIALVVLYNAYISGRPEFGDLDTLTIIFGGTLMIYPVVSQKFKVEAAFSMIFIALVVIVLVIPQATMSAFGSAGASRAGNWYVHYMLAAPFAGALDLMGIPASSSGNLVTLEFADGSVHTLGISAYCAGLYSFSIFLAAFFSFVLVFERLPRWTLATVLVLGMIVAYLGNLFRMIMIGVIGYYRGLEALLWAHENVGWMIFLGWSSVFWFILLRYTSRPLRAAKATGETL
jgi:archaeosortase C (PEF-CTERM variant)